MTERECEVLIPLKRRSKNHLGSIYLGVLCTGADCSAGLIAMKLIRESGKKVSLSFKDFSADFKKLAKGDVHFICKNGNEMSKALEETIKTGERVSLPIQVQAYVAAEHVAEFGLTLSVKMHSI